MTAEALAAAEVLASQNISAEVVHVPTIKPLDDETILASVSKTGLVATIEEHQISGGFGSAVSELLSQQLPTKMKLIGVHEKFGQSGSAAELLDEYGLSSGKIADQIIEFLPKKF